VVIVSAKRHIENYGNRPFSHHDPTSVPEAAELLEQLEDAKPLAGGQSLVPYLFFRMQRHRHLMDLNKHSPFEL
jgi:CO/xanthine dehydrogenase FAD-binding subunit